MEKPCAEERPFSGKLLYLYLGLGGQARKKIPDFFVFFFNPKIQVASQLCQSHNWKYKQLAIP